MSITVESIQKRKVRSQKYLHSKGIGEVLMKENLLVSHLPGVQR